MKIIESIAETFDDYDGYVLDLWGVVHDGRQPYPGVLEALAAMKAAGKRVAFLTNAPRRSWFIDNLLASMDIPRDVYVGTMSSGEATWLTLKARQDERFIGRAFHIGPERDLSVTEDGATELVPSPEIADFLLNTGPDPDHGSTSAEPYRPLLKRCFDAGLPMVCVNPDRHVMVAGQKLICAGAFADIYREFGGEVLEIGKPDPSVYAPTLALLDGIPKHRIVAVGDTPHTDLAGADAVGIDSLWAMTGLFANAHGQDASAETVARLAAKEGVRPKAGLRGLKL